MPLLVGLAMREDALTDKAPVRATVLGLSGYGFHRLAVHTWPARSETSHPTAICVHGLTRTGRDFDVLAEALSAGRPVLCPDVAGRGASDWLRAADAYTNAQYMADLTAVIAHAGASTIDWVGTSMGGLLGIMLAAQPNTPIRRLVLNDVGPLVPRTALLTIADYVGADPYFPDFDAAVAYMTRVHAGFGNLAERHWRHLAQYAVRPAENGGYRLAYDPAIGAPFADREAIVDVDLWHLWDAITCPVLVVRGAQSELLTAETLAEMQRRGPGADAMTVPDAGHAPALLTPDQVEPVRAWLDG